MQRFVKENGGETLDVEFFPLDVTNFGPTINKIQTAKPDFVISALVGGAACIVLSAVCSRWYE